MPPPQVGHEHDRYGKSNTSNLGVTPAQSGSGVAILAAARAELFMMQRKVIETVAKRKEWVTGWAALVKSSSLSDIDLNGTPNEADGAAGGSPETGSKASSERLLSPPLASALTAMDDFRAAFEVGNAWT